MVTNHFCNAVKKTTWTHVFMKSPGVEFKRIFINQNRTERDPGSCFDSGKKNHLQFTGGRVRGEEGMEM